MFGAKEIREYGDTHQSEVYFEVECPRCGRTCRLYLRDMP